MRKPPDLEAMLARATEFVAAERYYDATYKYGAAAKFAPADERVRCGIALGRVGTDYPPTVISEMLAVLRARPGAAYAHGIIGMAMQEMGRWEGALSSYEAMVDADPSETAARAKKAQALLMLGREKEAGEAARELAGMPPSGREYPREAMRLRRIADEAAAGRGFRPQVSDDFVIMPGLRELLDQTAGPDPGGAPDIEGMIVAGAADLEAAAGLAGSAMKTGSADAMIAMGAVLADGGRSGEASACYDRAIAAEPGNMRAHMAKAILVFDGGDAEGAEECMLRAGKARPTGKNSMGTRKVLRQWRESIAAGKGMYPVFGPFRGMRAIGRWTAGRRQGMGAPPAGGGRDAEAARAPWGPGGTAGMFPPGLAEMPDPAPARGVREMYEAGFMYRPGDDPEDVDDDPGDDPEGIGYDPEDADDGLSDQPAYRRPAPGAPKRQRTHRPAQKRRVRLRPGRRL